MQEEWKDILNYEGCYQISNLGRVKNLERQVKTKGDNNYRTVKERIRVPQVKSNGYHIATLCNGKDKTKTFQVHQLVAQAFLPNFIKGMELNHIDGNPGNNSITNLEISNRSHNQLHAIRIGLRAPTGVSKYHHVSYISKNPRAKARWAVCIRYNGKTSYGWKTFMTELEAAKYADELLDSINDTQRLRNFP
jgi:hypothetical protein